MVFGINVAGALALAPIAKLDVWVRAPVLSQVTDVAEETIRTGLRKSHVVVRENDACIVRLSTREEAERLVSQLKQWAEEGQAKMVA